MSLKFSGEELKKLRKEAGYNQLQLADIIGIRRETVSAIENERVGTIDNIGADIIKKWFDATRHKVTENRKESFLQYWFDYITK
jgi:DNA-binding XRE family transcriptional regulator